MAKPPHHPEVTAEEVQFLELLNDLWKRSGNWASALDVKLECRRRGGDQDELIKSLSPAFILRESEPLRGKRIRLTLAGVSKCNGGLEVVDAFLKLVRLAAEKVIERPWEKAEVSKDNFKGFLPDHLKKDVDRISRLVLDEFSFKAGGGGQPEGDWTIECDDSIVRFYKVSSVEEYRYLSTLLSDGLAQPTEEHRRLFRLVYRYWRKARRWPNHPKLVVAYRHHGDVNYFIRELGDKYIRVLQRHDPPNNRIVELRLEGVIATGIASDDLDLLARIVRELCEGFIRTSGKGEFSAKQVAEVLQAPLEDVQRVGPLIQYESTLPIHFDRKGEDWIAKPEEHILAFDNVCTAEDLINKRLELSLPSITPEEPADLGDWHCLSKLGEGGQASTYLVKRKADLPGSSFAMKILKPWNPDPTKSKSEQQQRDRFKGEVEALKRLNSLGCPRIAQVIEHHLAPRKGKQPWFVMPYYVGGVMCKLTPQGQIETYAEDYEGNINRVLEIADQLAETLAFIHEKYGLHRDVKTSNVFFGVPGGPPILGDFGLATDRESDKAFSTEVRQAMGPWQSRPPELQPGSTDKKNPKADVYLLGGLIYEALTRGRYIERPENPPGTFVHEHKDFSIANHTKDPRVKHINILLRNMWAEDHKARFSATQAAEACRVVRNWKEDAPNPVLQSPSQRLTQAAARHRAKSPSYNNSVVRKQLVDTCDVVAQELGVFEESKPYEFHRRVGANVGDSPLKEVIEKQFPGCVWAAVRSLVGYEPDPPILYITYAILIRTLENEEVVAKFGINAELVEISRSFPGDPKHSTILREQAQKNLSDAEDQAERTLE